MQELTVELADMANILNIGIKDQMAALQWVEKNIGAFGGDKTKVRWCGGYQSTNLNNSRLGDGVWRECRSDHDAYVILEYSTTETG